MGQSYGGDRDILLTDILRPESHRASKELKRGDKMKFLVSLLGALALALCLLGVMTKSQPTTSTSIQTSLPTLNDGQKSNNGNKRTGDNNKTRIQDCDDWDVFKPYKVKIQRMKGDIQRIMDYVLRGPGKGTTYDELALFCDTFGPRMSGSKSLELAIEHLRRKMQLDSKLEVAAEPAMVPNWQLISHSCEILQPVPHPMSILTLGQSVSTNGTLEADVVLVHSFQELAVLGEAGKIKDKIVVYNYKFEDYPTSVEYRTRGALEAAKYGAAAALVRSVTNFSINSPHTGAGSRSIPTAAITVEDANLIERWSKRNKTVTIRLDIQTCHDPDAQSFNLIGDIKGTKRPQEIVFVSGHMDSWYPTSGAMDDGGGMMISYKALDVLSKLGMKAERTMRAILWTAEEPGLVGVRRYFEDHKHELDNFKAVIESDEGTFRPMGLSYKNLGDLGQCVVQEILFLTAPLGTVELTQRYEGSDIELFTEVGVPGLSLFNENSRYFWFHHTAGDTMDVEDADELDRSTGLFAATVYALANLDVDLKD